MDAIRDTGAQIWGNVTTLLTGLPSWSALVPIVVVMGFILLVLNDR